jgi:hypothetical protein
VLLTLRAMPGLPSLRERGLFLAARDAIARSSTSAFRIAHFGVQRDHVHALVEADDGEALRRGSTGLAIRVAQAVNAAMGLHGRIWADRYHTRPLRTPREARIALVYVLQNVRKHRPELRAGEGYDRCSSALWFDGWLESDRLPSSPQPSPVAPPRTWLLRVGWRRHGLVSLAEAPRPDG